MPKFYNSDSRKIAYVSLAVNPNGSDLEKIHNYCMNRPHQVDVFAEEVHPNDMTRPLFQEVLDLIENDEVSMLIVPNLYHLCGDNLSELMYLTRFLDLYDVKVVITDKADLLNDEFSEQSISGFTESL